MHLLRLDYPALSAQTNEEIYEYLAYRPADDPEFADTLAEPGLDVAELTQHAMFIPLAPGDVLAYEIETSVPTRILRPAHVWTLNVEFHTPTNLAVGVVLPPTDPAMVAIRESIERWQQQAWATQSTGLSCYVSSNNREWLEREVIGCRYVEHTEVIRHPGMEIDLAVAIESADLTDLTIGPWS